MFYYCSNLILRDSQEQKRTKREYFKFRVKYDVVRMDQSKYNFRNFNKQEPQLWLFIKFLKAAYWAVYIH